MSSLFQFKKRQYIVREIPKRLEAEAEKPAIPGGIFEKCVSCSQIIYNEDLIRTNKVCPNCGYHFRLSARERVALVVDEGTFEALSEPQAKFDPLQFPGYPEKLRAASAATGLSDAILTGEARIEGMPCVLAAMDGNFFMGSMGALLGETMTCAVEHATKLRLPMVAFTVSGGARMQEGIISLMQMAKTAGALARHNDAGLLYISVLTDPTTGGVTASFATLGDIILAEPRALIGFAGQRVIEQTIKQKLPEGFQRAEFLLEKGFIDRIVPRSELRGTLSRILSLHRTEVGA